MKAGQEKPSISEKFWSPLCLVALLALGLMSSCSSATVATEAPAPIVTRTAPALGPTEFVTPLPPTSTVEPPLPTAVPIPDVGDQDWRRGSNQAAIQMVVYSDFQ